MEDEKNIIIMYTHINKYIIKLNCAKYKKSHPKRIQKD